VGSGAGKAGWRFLPPFLPVLPFLPISPRGSAKDDPLLARGLERFCDLPRDWQRLV
jgi:hypothetical protein